MTYYSSLDWRNHIKMEKPFLALYKHRQLVGTGPQAAIGQPDA